MVAKFPLSAAALSIIGATLGGALWLAIALATDLERAVPAILVGILAGAATRLEPHHRGRGAQVFAVAVTFIALTITQYFVVRHAAVTDLGDSSISLFLSFPDMLNVTYSWLRVFPVDIVFWVLASVAAFFLPAGAVGLSTWRDPLPRDEPGEPVLEGAE